MGEAGSGEENPKTLAARGERGGEPDVITLGLGESSQKWRFGWAGPLRTSRKCGPPAPAPEPVNPLLGPRGLAGELSPSSNSWALGCFLAALRFSPPKSADNSSELHHCKPVVDVKERNEQTHLKF
jgi:hypothetical protein